MSDNIPRPPRPPRPGAKTSSSAPRSGIKPGGDSANDFGDTRTVILSRKSMSMMQTRKEEEAAAAAAASSSQAAAPAAAPAMQKAKVENGTVFCVSCSASFPIVSDEFYGAVVECPDCSAEFVIPSKAELNTPAAAPAPAPVQAAAPAPAPAPAKKTPKKRKPVRNVPSYIDSEVKDSEEVIFCEAKDLGNGVSAGLVGGIVGMAGGVAGAVVGKASPVGLAIAGGVGVVAIVIGLVLGKKAGGKVGVAVTDERVIVKGESGNWLVQSELE